MRASDFEIHNYNKLDNILSKLCDMVVKGQKSENDYGMVAAAVVDPDNQIVARLNRPGDSGKRIHAEHAAMLDYTSKHGDIPKGSIIITTLSPCNEHMDERDGPSCTELINNSTVKKVYCGYMDPTQDDDTRQFNLMETADRELRTRCKQFADTFLDNVHENFADGRSPGRNSQLNTLHDPQRMASAVAYLTDYYDSKEEAYRIIDAYTSSVDKLITQGGAVYRAVWVAPGQKPKLKQPGLHWTLTPQSAEEYLQSEAGEYAAMDMDLDDQPHAYILSATVGPNNITNHGVNFAQQHHEQEVRIVDPKQAQIKVVKQVGMTENFADGKNPQDKGDSKRHGIPKHATMAELDNQVRQTLNAWMEQDQQFKDPTQREGFQAKVWPYIQENIRTILADKGKKGNGDYPAAPYAAWLLVQHMDAYPQNQIEFYNKLKQAIPNHPKIQFLRDRAAVNQWILQNANNPKYYYNSEPLPNPTVNVRNPAMFKDAGIVATSREEALNNAINAGNKLLVAAVRATKAKTQPSYKQGVAENFADGRHPEDKGDSKRHGINTKASVSSLRKTAKQGGRKGQLAHWLANMKSGRAKNK